MRASKKNTIDLCRFVAAYHLWPAGYTLTYPDFVGLFLNRRLPLLWGAAGVAMGIGVALGQRPDPAMFQAMYDTDAEAVEAAWDHSAELARKRAMASRWGAGE